MDAQKWRVSVTPYQKTPEYQSEMEIVREEQRAFWREQDEKAAAQAAADAREARVVEQNWRIIGIEQDDANAAMYPDPEPVHFAVKYATALQIGMVIIAMLAVWAYLAWATL